MGSAETRRYHVVVFDAPELALHATKRLRTQGYVIEDVHSPFPIHGMEKALGLRETRLAYGPLAGGLVGLTLALLLQIWTHSVDWPLNVGGKSMIALPALIPVSFELTVLLAGLATFVALLWSCRLRPKKGIPVEQPHLRVNDDRFALVVVESDGRFIAEEFRALCKELQSVELIESWRVV